MKNSPVLSLPHIIVGLLVFIVLFVIVKTLQIPEYPVHYHANFAVFINGKQKNFALPEYMNIEPCTDEHHEEKDPKKLVHLHDQIGNVVHVHAENIPWSALFSYLHLDTNPPVSATQSSIQTTTYYLNGNKVDNSVLNQTIEKNARLLVHIGSPSSVLTVADNEELKVEQLAVGDNALDFDTKSSESCTGTEKRGLLDRLRIAFHLGG